MTPLQPHRLRPVGSLLAACLGWLGPWAPAAEDAAPGWSLQAPSVELDEEVVTAREGFVLTTADGWTLVGDAIRWDLATGDVFATGRVALTLPTTRVDGRDSPGLRLEAAHIGLRRPPTGSDDPAIAERGEAWEVTVLLRNGQRLVRLRSDRVELTREAFILRGLSGDGGHGGILGLRATSLVVGLREREAEDRSGFERHVADVTLWNARPTLLGLPVMYSPVLYRDFRLDYPWTRYEFGDSSRLGPWIRGWTRFDLPPLGGWSIRQMLRLDWYEEAGTPWGARTFWRHDALGEGQFLYYGFDLEDETVVRDDGAVGDREVSAVDAEHRLGWRGVAGYARWVHLPDADPGAGWDERFRSDYLDTDLASRPLARRGATVAATLPLGSLVVDTDRLAHRDQPDVDRRYGIQAILPGATLLGPLRLEGLAWLEGLERDDGFDREADRLRTRVALAADHWFVGGLGVGGSLGLEGLGYFDGALASNAVDDAWRSVPVAEGTLRYQVIAAFDDDLEHRIVPRLGYRLWGDGDGDDLPAYRFGPGDGFREDLHELELGVATDLVRDRVLFRLDLATFWGVRDDDLPAGRSQADDAGDRLRRATIDLDGRPIASLDLDGRGEWDGNRRDWERFDAGLRWTASEHLALRFRATWRDRVDRWQYRPGLTVAGYRYSLRGDVIHDQDADEPRGLDLRVSRRMVDGVLSFGYALDRDEDGGELDETFTLAFSIDSFGL